jgi:beta-lactam-binding protein with PASTA domain
VTVVRVPQTFGMGLYSAEGRIIAAGLAVGTISVQRSSATAGTVLRTSPSANAQVAVGGRVDIVIAYPP